MKPRILVTGPTVGQVAGSHLYRSNKTGCPNYATVPYTLTTSVYYKATHGWDIENYHAKKKRGDLLPHTPFWQVEWKAKVTPGTHTATYKASPGCVGQLSTPFYSALGVVSDFQPEIIETLVPSVDLIDAQKFVQSAAERIYAKGHDTLTFLSELKKTTSMFRGVADKLRRLASGKSPGEIADLWMEGRYGWRTLMYDLIDLNGALTEFDASRKRYSERTGRSYTDVQSSSGFYSPGGQNMIKVSRVDSYEVSVRGSVTADIQPPQFRFNLVATGWELIPFSFVIDWLVDVGSAIMACSFLTLTDRYSASSGYVINLERETSLSAGTHTLYNITASGSREDNVTWTSRTPTSVPILPQLQLNVDWLKGLDLIAMIRQALR